MLTSKHAQMVDELFGVLVEEFGRRAKELVADPVELSHAIANGRLDEFWRDLLPMARTTQLASELMAQLETAVVVHPLPNGTKVKVIQQVPGVASGVSGKIIQATPASDGRLPHRWIYVIRFSEQGQYSATDTDLDDHKLYDVVLP